MKLLFLGTRGYIDVRSPRHRVHSALLVLHRGGRVMVDCGEDWLGRLDDLRPSAIVVTHAHFDHAWGLPRDVACPVHATAEGWSGMQRFPMCSEALRGLRLYVGDGASLVRPIVRGTGGERVGHAPIRTQLDWCRTAGVPRAIFTHCGTQIVRGQEDEMASRIRAMAASVGTT